MCDLLCLSVCYLLSRVSASIHIPYAQHLPSSSLLSRVLGTCSSEADMQVLFGLGTSTWDSPPHCLQREMEGRLET